MLLAAMPTSGHPQTIALLRPALSFPLQAALGDNLETVQALIAAKADVNAKGNNGQSVLHMAAVGGSAETIGTLLAGVQWEVLGGCGGAAMLCILNRSGPPAVLLAHQCTCATLQDSRFTCSPQHLLPKPATLSARPTSTRLPQPVPAAKAQIHAKMENKVKPIHVACLYGNAAGVEALVS